MRLWAIMGIGLFLVAASPGLDTFEAGDWKGRANFNGQGDFTDCTVLMPDPDGTTVGFVLTHGDDLGMIVANSALTMKPGVQKPVLVHADGLDSYAALADVVAENGILIPIETGAPLLTALEEGKKLRVTVREKEFDLQPPKTGQALEALKACVKTHRGKSRTEL